MAKEREKAKSTEDKDEWKQRVAGTLPSQTSKAEHNWYALEVPAESKFDGLIELTRRVWFMSTEGKQYKLLSEADEQNHTYCDPPHVTLFYPIAPRTIGDFKALHAKVVESKLVDWTVTRQFKTELHPVKGSNGHFALVLKLDWPELVELFYKLCKDKSLSPMLDGVANEFPPAPGQPAIYRPHITVAYVEKF